ncbi:MAG: DNA/RNA non-specific endonuclease [Lentisphaeria bacterium]|nr:DNA/RNA non-specific endonuclease [Lentisphaeria bacterium]
MRCGKRVLSVVLAVLLWPLAGFGTGRGTAAYLDLGLPSGADALVCRQGYALGYTEYHEQAAWVLYRLTGEQVSGKAVRRGSKFSEDPAIPTGSAVSGDYRNSGFDRGHLAPAADMAYSPLTMKESFYMSNISPQRPKFNRGVWKRLESQVRFFAATEKEICVGTGPVLPVAKTETVGRNRVTVPTHFYKVVYDRTPPEKMIGFIVPNGESRRPLREFAVPVSLVEALTGLDFFSRVPQPKQILLETTLSVADWRWQ